MTNSATEDAAVARAGWYALLQLLRAKGVITEAEALAVITKAMDGAGTRLNRPNCPPP